MNKLRLYYLSILVFTGIIVADSCYSPVKISTQNIAGIYRSEEHTMHPQFRLVHLNDSVSRLYFKINENELLYERRNQSDSFSASVRIFSRVTLSYESQLILDSNSTLLNIRSAENSKKEFLVGSMLLKLNAGNHYLVTIATYDMNSKRNEVTYLEADKSNLYGEQNFTLRDPLNGHILFTQYYDSAVTLSISYIRPLKDLKVLYYKSSFPAALPPFAENSYESTHLRPDSIFTLLPKSGNFVIALNHKGIYHILADSTDSRGLTLFRFEEHYPNIAEAYQMVAPMRYISSNDEYEKMTASANPKKNVDDFWLTASDGSKDRAKQLIHNYYNRVQDANRYYTSYLEGWKTDRGMIYIIFGAPTVISRTSGSEVWTYGEDRSYLTLSFTFMKLDNPFTDNDYVLERSLNFRNLWYNAVDAWREGRVY